MGIQVNTNHSYQIPSELSAAIFRAYDIRGKVDSELNANTVYAIGLAIGSEALELNQTEVIVGRDGRLSGPELVQALSQGLLDSGVNVIFIGQVPSPVLYFATHRLHSRSGVILTGSHNPKNYNGIKIVLNGSTLTAGAIQKLYQRILQKNLHRGHGALSEMNIVPDYWQYITDRIQLARPLRVVVDCGNGVAGEVAPNLYRELGCEVIELFCEVDGHFPNHHPDPTEPKNLEALIAKVKEERADCGLAFDGDGDRLGLVTNGGEIIWPDRQMMLFAIDVLARKPGSEIVFDVKCSSNLAKVISAHGGKPLMWKTGHSILKAKMQELNASLAGEMSGHIFFKEGWFGFDDGSYVGARLLQIFSRDSRSVSEIFTELPDSVNTPELKIEIPDEHKQAFIEKLTREGDFGSASLITIDGLRVDFGYGWGLIRVSNTTPCLTLRFEAENETQLAEIQQIFKTQIAKQDPSLSIPF